MTIKLSKSTAGRVDGGSNQHLIVAIAQQHARIAASAVAALTDSSGGTASATKTVVAVPADLANEANAGGNLASAATALAKLDLVKDALLELATKSNAIADAIGIPAAEKLTYNGGGTAADGTIGAIGTTTAAATGSQALNLNASILVLNEAMFTVAKFANKLSAATGKDQNIVSIVGEYDQTVAAITNAAGADASPGVTKVAIDAKLALYAHNIATIAARLNAIRAAAVPEIVVVD